MKRSLAPIALALLLSGCALPFGLKWPRMPWHKPPPKAEYCVVSLEMGNGLSVGNQAPVHMPCQVVPNSAPNGVPSRS
jgi:hypothetical protein